MLALARSGFPRSTGTNRACRNAVPTTGICEERFLGQDGDAARDGADDRRPIGVAGVVGREYAGAGRYILKTLDAGANSYTSYDEPHALDARPVKPSTEPLKAA